jgi:hypothetical protein
VVGTSGDSRAPSRGVAVFTELVYGVGEAKHHIRNKLLVDLGVVLQHFKQSCLDNLAYILPSLQDIVDIL